MVMVVKRSGESEPYSEEKVVRSMTRVGVPESLQPQVLKHIEARLHEGITTDEVFSHILEFLKEKDKKSSLRFNLRQALFDLGPTGFPFEQYIARIFKQEGYQARTNLTMEGECVTHEIDLLVEKDGKCEIVEAKFHNQTIGKTDVQVILYTYARFLDVKEKNKIDGVWVITNTKLTTDAIQYARCKGVSVLAWNYPEEKNLQYFIENPKMYPITILHGLTTEEKQRLLEDRIVLCSELLSVPSKDLEEVYGINKNRISEALESARLVSNGSWQ